MTERERTGTFVVTHADDGSAVVRDVETAQVLTLSSNPGLEECDVVEATVAPDPPLEVSWQVVEVVERRTIDVIDSDLEPTTQSKETALAAEIGDLTRTERAGTGEIHVFSVPPEEIDRAARDVVDDVETVARAARLEAVRVEVRWSIERAHGGSSEGTNAETGPDADADEADEVGVLSVRYLPD